MFEKERKAYPATANIYVIQSAVMNFRKTTTNNRLTCPFIAYLTISFIAAFFFYPSFAQTQNAKNKQVVQTLSNKQVLGSNGSTYSFSAGKTIVIPAGATVYIEGSLDISDNNTMLIVEGNLVIGGSLVLNDGSISVRGSGNLLVRGSFSGQADRLSVRNEKTANVLVAGAFDYSGTDKDKKPAGSGDYYVIGAYAGKEPKSLISSESILATRDLELYKLFKGVECNDVVVLKLKTIPEGVTTFCKGGSLTFTTSLNVEYNSNDFYTFFIRRGVTRVLAKGPSSGEGARSFSTKDLQTGDKVEVELTTHSGCTASASYGPLSVTEGFSNKPLLTADPNPMPIGSAVKLTTNVEEGHTIIAFDYDVREGGTDVSYINLGSEVVFPNQEKKLPSFLGGELVRVTVFDSNGCQSTSDPITIQAGVLPKVEISADKTTLCKGDMVTVSLTKAEGTPKAYAYYRNDKVIDGASGSSLQLTDIANGDKFYVVATYDNSITSRSNTLEFVVNELPVVELKMDSGHGAICSGSEVKLVATAGFQKYVFTIDSGTSVVDIENQGSNSYSGSDFSSDCKVRVRASDSNGCVGVSLQHAISVFPKPSVSLNMDEESPICEGKSVQFTATAEGVKYLGETSTISSYTFSVNGVVVPAGASESNMLTYSMPEGNPVPVIVRVVDSRGCSAEDVQRLVVKPSPVASLSVTDSKMEICKGEKVRVTASGGSLYRFTIGSQPSGDLSNVNYVETSLLSSNDIIRVEVVGDNLCSSTAETAAFKVKDLPIVELKADKSKICEGEEVKFVASPATFADYRFVMDGSEVLPQEPLHVFTTRLLSNQSTVSVRVKDPITTCWGQSEQLKTNVVPLPKVTIGIEDNINIPNDNYICVDSKVNLVAPSGGGRYVFTIDGVVHDNGSLNTYKDVTLPTDGMHSVSVEMFVDGCSAKSNTETITVHSQPGVPGKIESENILWDKTILRHQVILKIGGEAVTLPYWTSNRGTMNSYDTFFWEVEGNPAFGSISDVTSSNPSITWTRYKWITPFKLIVKATNLGCGLSDSLKSLDVYSKVTFAPPSTPILKSDACRNHQILFETKNNLAEIKTGNIWEITLPDKSIIVSDTTEISYSSPLINQIGNARIRVRYAEMGSSWSPFLDFTIKDVVTASITPTDTSVCPQSVIKFSAPIGGNGYRFYRVRNGVQHDFLNQPQKEDFISINTSTDPNDMTAIINGDQVGVEVFSTCGSSSAISSSINVRGDIKPLLSVSKRYSCYNDNAPLTLTATEGGLRYEWFVDGIKKQETKKETCSSIVPSGLEVGLHKIKVYVTFCSRMESNEVLFTVLPTPTGSLIVEKTSPQCAGTPVTLTTIKGYEKYEFLVDGISQGVHEASNNPNANVFTHYPLSKSSYAVKVFGCGVWSEDFPSVSVDIIEKPPKPTLTPNPADVCPNSSITLSAPLGYGAYRFTVGEEVKPETSQNMISIPSKYAGRNITVQMKNSCFWSSSSDPVVVQLKTGPSYTWNEFHDKACAGCTYPYKISNSSATYTWSLRLNDEAKTIDLLSQFNPTNPTGQDVRVHFGNNRDYFEGLSTTPLQRLMYVRIVENGCEEWVSKPITIFRVPVTGPPYHIGNNVSK